MALVCVLWLGAVGMADDWLKLTAGRRSGSRQGLTSLEKILFQIGLGVVLSYFTYQHGRTSKMPTRSFSRSSRTSRFQLSADRLHHPRHDRADRLEQRREPDRRPRRPGRRHHGDRQLRVHGAGPDRRPTARRQEAAAPAREQQRRDGRHRRRDDRGVPRVSSGSTATPPASSWATPARSRSAA